MSSEHITAERLHLSQWQDRLQESIDQALSPAETLQVHAHLASCTMCTREHRRLLAVDARLRNRFAVTATPSSNFDKTLFANIAALEQDRRAAARQREQQEYAARVAQLRGSWRELVRFQLGNVIAGMATVAAVVTAIASAWPTMTRTAISTMNKELPEIIGAQQVAWLPGGWNATLPMTAVIASAIIAAAAVWIARSVDRRPG